ncbi:tetratricopeptide repeat protein [Nonomuraea sp. NPDC049309]|uniref:tetratricopeptide repeat protein n=1 Tax=Nonomuraea sp. NPDC049309 TaxID=3364350 RepID=UPI003721144B
MLLQEINELIAYDESLRMVPGDRERLRALIEPVRARNPADYATLRALGVGLLVLGEYGDAVDHLDRALGLADTARRRIAVTLNLADVHRYSGGVAAAEALCRETVALAREEAPELLSFALQHLGKALIDLGRREEAREVLEEALALRVADGDPELIAGSRAALRLLDR